MRPRPGPVAGAAEAPPAGARARDLSWGLIAVAWAWANAHISYFLGFVLIGIHLVEDRLERRDPRRLAWILLACVGVSLLNPFGWRALWQPFDYFLRLRHEPLFRGIGELQPVSWSAGRSDGTFVLLLGWPVLLLWRARRFGPDRVEVMLCAFLTAYALPAQRFLGTYAVVAAPYAARDLDAWVRSRRWPVWSANAWVRACLASAAIVGAGLPEWSDRDRPLGIGIDWKRFPVAACDFMGAHAVAGRGFGETRVAGYQLWCFWPDRTRLPFMDIHQTGTPADRALYAAVFSRRSGWAEMVRRHTFDYILLDRYQYPGDSLADVLDADSTWSLVFLDDAAALYVRRGGPLRAVADSFGYRLLGAGPERTTALAAAWGADSALRAGCRTELEREAAGSALDAAAERGLGMLALADRRTADARRHLERALDVDPATPRTHEALGTVELWDGQPGQALLEFERERAVSGWYPGLELRMGMACQAAGDRAGARRHFERELARYPDDARARALIEGLESAP